MNLTPQIWGPKGTNRPTGALPVPFMLTPGERVTHPTPPRLVPVATPRAPRLGARLIASGLLTPQDLERALERQASQQSRLGHILVTQGLITQPQLLEVLADQWQAEIADFQAHAPDTRLVDAWGSVDCLNQGLMPWRRVGGATLIATARPEELARHQAALEEIFGPIVMALTSEEALVGAITKLRARRLALRAETRVPEPISCRGKRPLVQRILLPLVGGAVLGTLLLSPMILLVCLLAWAALTLAAISALKLAAIVLALSKQDPVKLAPTRPLRRRPVISVMVPLFHEENVANHLLKRMSRLTYPRELTDILLVCEEDDTTTAAALARTDLPSWVRVVTVPRGGVQTKPRALNYALDFCRGSIVGVWDAEDAPDPEQLQKVAEGFHVRGPEVACLQGSLDYYNTRTNWLSRCFTIEYAAWFRAFLPVLENLRLPIPLGGTTLFFRRSALETLGCWDAFNVTEDADLGLRLCRAGYRTALIDSVTEEEANCAPLAWIKQRSRWLKGYGLTWAVHMRHPVQLWRDLGPRAFWGVQVLFLGSLSQFILAPLLWTFWPMAFGLWHPLTGVLPQGVFIAMIVLFLTAEVISMGLAYAGLRAAGKRHITPVILTLPAYFPLAVAACYKGIWESLNNPFLWHKTTHGLHDADEDTPVEASPQAA